MGDSSRGFAGHEVQRGHDPPMVQVGSASGVEGYDDFARRVADTRFLDFRAGALREEVSSVFFSGVWRASEGSDNGRVRDAEASRKRFWET